MDTAAYLSRISYTGSLDPTAETLRGLHTAHILAVPFENLDIGLGRTITLDTNLLFDKIVTRRRGGFCYEMNGLFAELLRSLGFQVTLLSAGVARDAGGFGPDFDHLTLQVRTSDEAMFLADVGFGDSFRAPLRLDVTEEQVEGDRTYRIDHEGEYLTLMQRRADSAWKPQHRFTLQPRQFTDFAGMCHYHQTSPASSFTRGRVCTLATPQGRITLADLLLITTSNGVRQEQTLGSEDEWRVTLRELFGVDVER